MTWQDFARIATDLYNELRRRGYFEKDIWALIDLYFASGVYKYAKEPEATEEANA